MGGSSAFGAKAGDVFTRITIVAASVWIVVCVLAAYWAGNRGDRLGDSPASSVLSPPSVTSSTAAEEEQEKETDETSEPPVASEAEDSETSGTGAPTTPQ
jgi:preprotein translocase subunit SecG